MPFYIKNNAGQYRARHGGWGLKDKLNGELAEFHTEQQGTTKMNEISRMTIQAESIVVVEE